MHMTDINSTHCPRFSKLKCPHQLPIQKSWCKSLNVLISRNRLAKSIQPSPFKRQWLRHGLSTSRYRGSVPSYCMSPALWTWLTRPSLALSGPVLFVTWVQTILLPGRRGADCRHQCLPQLCLVWVRNWVDVLQLSTNTSAVISQPSTSRPTSSCSNSVTLLRYMPAEMLMSQSWVP